MTGRIPSGFAFRRRLPAAALLVLCPGVASAHMVSSGLGDFYDGLLHPFLSLGQLLPVLALAIWAGGRGAAAGRLAVVLLPLGWLAGGLLGAGIEEARLWLVLAAASGLACGIAGAADLPVPSLPVGGVAAVVGLLLGVAASATESAPNWRLAAGMAAAGTAIALVVAGQRSVLRGQIAPVVSRVGASWIAAASLLQLGWMARGHVT